MKMKKIFDLPQLHVLQLEANDVITASDEKYNNESKNPVDGKEVNIFG